MTEHSSHGIRGWSIYLEYQSIQEIIADFDLNTSYGRTLRDRHGSVVNFLCGYLIGLNKRDRDFAGTGPMTDPDRLAMQIYIQGLIDKRLSRSTAITETVNEVTNEPS